MIKRIELNEYDGCSNIRDMKKSPFTSIFKDEIKNGNRLVFVYVVNGKFVGEGDLVFDKNDPDYTVDGKRIYLSRLIVKKEYRNKGIGTEIMKFLINKAREMNYSEISLGVDCINGAAIHLYEKFGFEIIKKDKDEYGEFFKMVKII